MREDDLNVEEMMESQVQPSQEQHTSNFVKESHRVVSEDPALREMLEDRKIFAETILQNRFSPEEKELFARVIRQFNELYWEMGIQTWSSTKYRGVNVLKPPTDMWIYQELIFTLKPDLIIESGTMCGGSALFMRDMMDIMQLPGEVVTIDISEKNLHPSFIARMRESTGGLRFLNAQSTDPAVLHVIQAMIHSGDRVMVILDSDHSYENVMNELIAYGPLVTLGSVLIVEDTSNTLSAKQANDDWYFDNRKFFKRDFMCEKLMLTFNRDGYYERIG